MITRRQLCGALAGAYAAPLLAQGGEGTGPAVGQSIPDFQALDQDGNSRSFADVAGAKGLLLLFYRSADW
jgi:hypothetical protein